MSTLDGILLVDKPAGWTSHDVVARVRRLTGQRRIGHCGTLDPAATGLLVLCLGVATRLVEYLTGHDKQYAGEIVLGATTTTDDAEGEVLVLAQVPMLDAAALHVFAGQFTGAIAQVPPAYSAIKIDGRRAYTLARKGQAPALVARRVCVQRLALRQLSAGRLAIEADCGPGTYIRSLARDIGAAIGCGGHLTALRRLRSGPFAVEDALSLAAVEAAAAAGRVGEVLLAMDAGLLEMAAALVTAERAARLRQGGRLDPVVPWTPAAPVRLYDAAGGFVGVGAVGAAGEIRALKVLGGGASEGEGDGEDAREG